MNYFKSLKCHLVRFADPEPTRSIGLVWRTTSPRKEDFLELGRFVGKAWKSGPLAAAQATLKATRGVSAPLS